MTCIVGLIKNDIVYIGGDSAGASGYSLTVRKDRKVFRNGNTLIGGTTSFRMLQLLQYAFEQPKYNSETSLEKYMATSFVDAVRQCLKDGGYAQKENEQESAGQFLIGFQGRLFRIDSDYQVLETVDGYDAIGCGGEIALGTLYATPDMAPEQRLELALHASERHNIGVRGPFHIEVLREAKS